MEKQLNNQDLSEKNDTSKVYEVSYLLMPTMSEEQVPGKVLEINNFLNSSGAEIISYEEPVLIDLAYPMTKVIQTYRHTVEQGYFGWVKFEVSSEVISSVKKFLESNSDILRYLIIKTVRENTLVNGKMKLKIEDKSKKIEEDLVGDDDVSDKEDSFIENNNIDDEEKEVEDLVLA